MGYQTLNSRISTQEKLGRGEYEAEEDDHSIYEKCARFLSLNRASKAVLYMGPGGEESDMGCQSLMG